MDFNCIFHLTAYLKDKPDILVKEALRILCSTGRTVEQAVDTLTGIFSVGGGEELDRYLSYIEPYREGREVVTARNGCLGIIDELGAAGVSVSCCDCKYIPMRKKQYISVADDILLLRCCVLDSTFLYVDTSGGRGEWTASRIRNLRRKGLLKTPVLLYRSDTLSLSYPIYDCAYDKVQGIPRLFFNRKHDGGMAIDEDTYRTVVDEVCKNVITELQVQADDVRESICQCTRDMLLPLSEIKDYPKPAVIEQALSTYEKFEVPRAGRKAAAKPDAGKSPADGTPAADSKQSDSTEPVDSNKNTEAPGKCISALDSNPSGRDNPVARKKQSEITHDSKVDSIPQPEPAPEDTEDLSTTDTGPEESGQEGGERFSVLDRARQRFEKAQKQTIEPVPMKNPDSGGAGNRPAPEARKDKYKADALTELGLDDIGQAPTIKEDRLLITPFDIETSHVTELKSEEDFHKLFYIILSGRMERLPMEIVVLPDDTEGVLLFAHSKPTPSGELYFVRRQAFPILEQSRVFTRAKPLTFLPYEILASFPSLKKCYSINTIWHLARTNSGHMGPQGILSAVLHIQKGKEPALVFQLKNYEALYDRLLLMLDKKGREQLPNLLYLDTYKATGYHMNHMELICEKENPYLFDDTTSGIRYQYNPRSILAETGYVKFRVSVGNLKPGAADDILQQLATSYCTHKWFQSLPIIYVGMIVDYGEFHFIARRDCAEKFINTMHLDFVRLVQGRTTNDTIKIKITEETSNGR